MSSHVKAQAARGTRRCCCHFPCWLWLQSQAWWAMDLGAPWAARMAYLLGIASEHRIDQLDPVGQAGGNHIAWAAGRPDPLVQAACSELSPVRAGSSQPAGQNQTQQVHLSHLWEVPTWPRAPAASHISTVRKMSSHGSPRPGALDLS